MKKIRKRKTKEKKAHFRNKPLEEAKVHLNRILCPKEKGYHQARAILERSFPSEELDPREVMEECFEDEGYRFFTIKTPFNKVIGACSGIMMQTLGFEFFFEHYIAIEKSMRNKGYGKTAVMEQISDLRKEAREVGKKLKYLVVEVEQPGIIKEDEMRNRIRPKFHTKYSGVKATLIDYVTPNLENEEREDVKFLLCVNPLTGEHKKTVNLKDVVSIVYNIYLDYELEGAKLADYFKRSFANILKGVEKLGLEDFENINNLLERIPDVEIKLVNIMDMYGKNLSEVKPFAEIIE
ncbi:GNAT family N-acetyltransferase [Candidatus Micrarchaeota archaeon]|nr:GNAT family N-acetyltransferase [Candidatus Micrarchaeota archaeon]